MIRYGWWRRGSYPAFAHQPLVPSRCLSAGLRGNAGPFQSIPVLAQPSKSNGSVNYNYYGNIAICRAYQKDAWYGLRHHPRVFLTSVAFATCRYFIPSSALPVSPQNQQHIQALIHCYDILYGKIPWKGTPSGFLDRVGHPPYLSLLLGLPILFLFGLWQALRRACSPQQSILVFICFAVAMTSALGCTLDFLDASRYRFVTDGFYVVLLGLLLEMAAKAIKRPR